MLANLQKMNPMMNKKYFKYDQNLLNHTIIIIVSLGPYRVYFSLVQVEILSDWNFEVQLYVQYHFQGIM